MDRGIVVADTVKWLNMICLYCSKDQNTGVHKGHVLVLRQVLIYLMIYLSYKL